MARHLDDIAVRTADPEPAGVLLRWFLAAERRFGVDHELLAAVMLIETRFGRIVSRSYSVKYCRTWPLPTKTLKWLNQKSTRTSSS